MKFKNNLIGYIGCKITVDDADVRNKVVGGMLNLLETAHVSTDEFEKIVTKWVHKKDKKKRKKKWKRVEQFLGNPQKRINDEPKRVLPESLEQLGSNIVTKLPSISIPPKTAILLETGPLSDPHITYFSTSVDSKTGYILTCASINAADSFINSDGVVEVSIIVYNDSDKTPAILVKGTVVGRVFLPEPGGLQYES